MIGFIQTADGFLMVVVDGHPIPPIAPDHPSFGLIVEAIRKNDAAAIKRLLDIRAAVAQYSDGRVALRDGVVTLDGRPVHPNVSARMHAMMSAGLPFTHLARFLERVNANPSARVLNELFGFLAHKGLPIVDDGRFLGYKRIRWDWTDAHTGTVRNMIGDTPTMPRNLVDDNWGLDCSQGFHVGSLEYITTFYPEGRIVIVAVDPADVVTVPSMESTKLRTCKYEVIAEYTGRLDQSPLYTRVAEPVMAAAAQAIVPGIDVAGDEDYLEEGEGPGYGWRGDDDDDSDDDAGIAVIGPDDPLAVGLVVDECPRCYASLTAPGSVELMFRILDQPLSARSRIDDDAAVVDVADGLIGRGMLAAVRCGGCQMSLGPWLQTYRGDIQVAGPATLADVVADIPPMPPPPIVTPGDPPPRATNRLRDWFERRRRREGGQ